MHKHAGKRILLSAFCILLLISCSSPTHEAIPSTDTPVRPSATIPPSETPLPIETTIPNISSTPNMFATQLCMGSTASWSCSCGNLLTDNIEIKSATRTGQCDVLMPKRYAIVLPDNWYCNTVGVFANNLSCVTAYGQKILIHSVISELPLENADETIDVFREGDGYWADPVVQPDEQKIEREIKTIGSEKVLRLLSKQNDLFILRYFMKNSDNLYILIFESDNIVEVSDLTVLLEDIVVSMLFTQ